MQETRLGASQCHAGIVLTCLCKPYLVSEYVCHAGIVFTCLCEPYLVSEYGSEYMGDSPVKLLDQLLHGRKEQPAQQVQLRFRLSLPVCQMII